MYKCPRSCCFAVGEFFSIGFIVCCGEDIKAGGIGFSYYLIVYFSHLVVIKLTSFLDEKFSSFANFVIESNFHLFLVIEAKNRYSKDVSTSLQADHGAICDQPGSSVTTTENHVAKPPLYTMILIPNAVLYTVMYAPFDYYYKN
jgi:hypothetical protein